MRAFRSVLLSQKKLKMTSQTWIVESDMPSIVQNKGEGTNPTRTYPALLSRKKTTQAQGLQAWRLPASFEFSSHCLDNEK